MITHKIAKIAAAKADALKVRMEVIEEAHKVYRRAEIDALIARDNAIDKAWHIYLVRLAEIDPVSRV